MLNPTPIQTHTMVEFEFAQWHLLSFWISKWYSCSSGTTQGKPKYVPWNDELFETTMQIYETSFAFRNRYSISFFIFAKTIKIPQQPLGIMYWIYCTMYNGTIYLICDEVFSLLMQGLFGLDSSKREKTFSNTLFSKATILLLKSKAGWKYIAKRFFSVCFHWNLNQMDSN